MKKLLFGFLLATIFVSCKSEKNMETNDHQALVKTYFEHFNAHNWQKMAEMYADTADFKDPSLRIDIVKQTHQQTIKKYSELARIFPDLKDEVIATYPSGDKNIIVEFISTGTAPDGSKFELPICTIFTIENGKISKDFTYYDNSQE
jgi:ketosteroid isomerase-like protein